MPLLVSQSAAIPVLDGRVCMVSSRSGRRWVFPKGQIEEGHSPGEAALLEAWEEAGVVGVLEREPVGNYLYEKLGAVHHVIVYRLEVTEEHDAWPESDYREREWLTVAEALERVEEFGLRAILRRAFFDAEPVALRLALS